MKYQTGRHIAHVRLGKVRKAIKSSIIQNTKAAIHLFACFGQKFERTIFERTILSQWVASFIKIQFEQNF